MECTSISDYLQFKKVLYKNLLHNRKYIMQIGEGTLYVGTCEIKKKKRNNRCKIFEISKSINGYINIINTTLEVSNTSYYVICPKKYNIQSAMEMRAVNKLLQQITGDETFVYN